MTERQKKSPEARAEEALAVANRLVERLTAKAKQVRIELDGIEKHRAAAAVRRDYLAKHPDLPQDRTPGPHTRTTSSGATTETP